MQTRTSGFVRHGVVLVLDPTKAIVIIVYGATRPPCCYHLALIAWSSNISIVDMAAAASKQVAENELES
jgi:hypothetical protein